MSNFIIHDVDKMTPRKHRLDQKAGAPSLTLSQYLDLARRMIGRFAPPNFRSLLLNSEDAIAFVAEHLMRGDIDYDPDMHVKLNTYRGRRGKWAITSFLRRLKEAEWAVPPGTVIRGKVVEPRKKFSLDYGDDADNGLNMHDMVSDQAIDNPAALFIDDEDTQDRRNYIAGLLSGLTEPQRKCVTMYFIEGVKPSKIAELLNVRRQAVQKALERGMIRLRKAAGVSA